MLLASYRREDDGRYVLVVGLHDENVDRLRNDEPIYKPLDRIPSLKGWDLAVLGPEDLERFVARSSTMDRLH